MMGRKAVWGRKGEARPVSWNWGGRNGLGLEWSTKVHMMQVWTLGKGAYGEVSLSFLGMFLEGVLPWSLFSLSLCYHTVSSCLVILPHLASWCGTPPQAPKQWICLTMDWSIHTLSQNNYILFINWWLRVFVTAMEIWLTQQLWWVNEMKDPPTNSLCREGECCCPWKCGVDCHPNVSN